MRTRRELLAGVGATIALAGCTGDGSEDGTTDGPATSTTDDTLTPETTTDTPTETPTETPSEDTTTTPEDTPTETPPEDTTTDTPEPDPDPDPEPEKEFEEIYREEMVGVTNISGVVGEQVDWQQVRNELEEDGHNLNNVTPSSEFIEDLAGHAGKQVRSDYGAAALAYGLHEEFNIGTDEVIVDARTYNAGQQAAMASILIKQSDGGVVKDLYAPFGDGQHPDKQGDVLTYQRHDEPNPQAAEQTITDAWTAAKDGIWNWLDKDGIEAMINRRSGFIEPEGQNTLSRLNDDLIIGYHSEDSAAPEKGGEVVYTGAAFEQMGDVLDPKNINANPETTGVQARDLVVNATEQYHNNVDREAGDFLAIGFDGEDFTYNIVDKDRKEELEHELLSEYLQE
jgi:hypothetical protein